MPLHYESWKVYFLVELNEILLGMYTLAKGKHLYNSLIFRKKWFPIPTQMLNARWSCINKEHYDVCKHSIWTLSIKLTWINEQHLQAMYSIKGIIPDDTVHQLVSPKTHRDMFLISTRPPLHTKTIRAQHIVLKSQII